MNMRKTLMLIIVMFLVNSLPAVLSAASDEEISKAFKNAGELYEKGSFDEAIKEYEKILKTGKVSGNIFYNMGNCYFKKNQLGMAMLNYERAKRLIPRDKDLEANYEYAVSKMDGGNIYLGGNIFYRVIYRMFSWMTIDGVIILCSGIYLAVSGLLIMGVMFSRSRKAVMYLVIILILSFIPSAFGAYYKFLGINRDAVVMDKICDVKFEPFPEATTFFQIYEGNKVRIENNKDDWTKIRRQDGKSGWIKDSALVVI